MKGYFLLFFLVMSGFCLPGQVSDSDRIVGIWKSPSEGLMIKIDKVGDHFQGRIVWLNHSELNQPALDINNPDENLQKIPLKGNKVIRELSYNSSELIWEGGTFYDHKEGKLYNCQIKIDNDKLKITRYIQNPQDGIVDTWVRH